jgi:hypothetical protein
VPTLSKTCPCCELFNRRCHRRFPAFAVRQRARRWHPLCQRDECLLEPLRKTSLRGSKPCVDASGRPSTCEGALPRRSTVRVCASLRPDESRASRVSAPAVRMGCPTSLLRRRSDLVRRPPRTHSNLRKPTNSSIHRPGRMVAFCRVSGVLARSHQRAAPDLCLAQKLRARATFADGYRSAGAAGAADRLRKACATTVRQATRRAMEDPQQRECARAVAALAKTTHPEVEFPPAIRVFLDASQQRFAKLRAKAREQRSACRLPRGVNGQAVTAARTR